ARAPSCRWYPADSRSCAHRLEVEHHAPDNAAGLEILERAVCLVGRARLDRRRLDLALFRERHHFLQLLQAADVGADDADGALRDRRQRMRELAAVQAADHVAAAFP